MPCPHSLPGLSDVRLIKTTALAMITQVDVMQEFNFVEFNKIKRNK
jgi:hypothetical protein